MQRYYSVFLLTFLFVPSVGANPFIYHLRKEISKKIQKHHQKIAVFEKQEVNRRSKENNLTPLSAENEHCIRRILDEMGLESNSIKLWHQPGIYAHTIGRNLYINQDWFETLNEEEKRFLIGHEAVHIKENHIDYKAYIAINPNSFEPNEFLSLGFDFEREADLKAAKKLNCVDGGISLMKAFRKEKLNSDFDDQPSCAERIYHLQQLKKRLPKERNKEMKEKLKKSWMAKLGQLLWWKKQRKETKTAFGT